MQQRWINKQSNSNCILFFNGWGMDENAIHNINCSGFDVYMIYDYKVLESINMNPNAYRNNYVVAWSMGVWAAEQILLNTKYHIAKYIAINGTPAAIHNEYGILEKVFDATLQGWNEINRNKFNARMMGGMKMADTYSHYLSKRSIDDSRDELEAIYKYSKTNNEVHINWNKAFIGENDLIFTSQNQQRWWNGKTEISITTKPHFPFIGITDWKEIIASN